MAKKQAGHTHSSISQTALSEVKLSQAHKDANLVQQSMQRATDKYKPKSHGSNDFDLSNG